MFTLFLYVIVFIFGLIMGSFFNCLMYRLEHDETIRGRSYCPHCKHVLSWYDLIPLVSFAVLKGHCRYCQKTISWRYPMVELATGLILIVVLYVKLMPFQYTPAFALNAVGLLYIVSALVAVFIFDLKHYIIPDKIIFPAICVGVLLRFFQGSIHNYVGAAALASGFFLVMYLISQGKWIGFGDVKLALLLGLTVGFPNILAALFLAFFFGAIIGVLLMIMQEKGLKSQVPFAPFLIAGTLAALFYGTEIIHWYGSFFFI